MTGFVRHGTRDEGMLLNNAALLFSSLNAAYCHQ